MLQQFVWSNTVKRIHQVSQQFDLATIEKKQFERMTCNTKDISQVASFYQDNFQKDARIWQG
jgi:hypothetical protein